MTDLQAHRSVPEICGGGRDGACAELVRALARGEGPLRFTELVYFCDPDGPEVRRVFARRPLRPHPLGHGRRTACGWAVPAGWFTSSTERDRSWSEGLCVRDADGRVALD